jgi:hypothetical protein
VPYRQQLTALNHFGAIRPQLPRRVEPARRASATWRPERAWAACGTGGTTDE